MMIVPDLGASFGQPFESWTPAALVGEVESSTKQHECDDRAATIERPDADDRDAEEWRWIYSTSQSPALAAGMCSCR